MTVSQEMYDGIRQELVRHVAKYKIYPKQKNFHWDILGEHIDWEDPAVKTTCVLRANAYVQAIERHLKKDIIARGR